MGPYLPTSVEADSMQTLYLMNPGYTGYTDATSNASQMDLITPPSSADNSSNRLPMQNFNGFLFPPSLTQVSHLPNIPNGQQQQEQVPSVVLYEGGINKQGYTNTDSWIASARNNVSLNVDRPSLVNNRGQHSTSDSSQYSFRQNPSLVSNGVSLGFNMETSQGLSLSLSPQKNPLMHNHQQSFQISEPEVDMSNANRFPNRWIGSLSSFRASSRDQNRLQNSLNGIESYRQMYLEPNSSLEEPTSGCLLTNSKYLKPAQQLLYEVVNVGRGIQSNNSNTLQSKMQSWMATGSMENESFAMEKAVLSESGRKDNIVLSPPQMATSTAAISTTAAISNAISAPQLNSENVSQLSMPERQEMQTKKAKLMAMLDEVNRRYKQYYKQMHTVVTSFEAAAGVGAAKTYTALALQTISRHFRCLRDAIRSQIEVSSKALGEEDLSGQGIGSSTLRFVDQQLHQFGMMQQHAWRPQRGLPERSVSVLRAWLFEHFLHPYPKDSDKVMLARRTGLSRSQVSNWFINARVRLWKPMVEEMYLEENRDANMGACTNSQLGNASEEGRKEEEEEGEEEEEEEETMAMKRKKSIGNSVDGIGNGGGSYNGQPGLNPDVGVSEQSNASEMMMMTMMMRRNNSNNNQNINSTPESQLIYEKEQMKKQSCLTRPENGTMLNDHNTGFSNLNMGIYEEDLRMKENTSNEIRGENKHDFSIPYQQQGGILQHADSLGGLDGSYINVGSLVGRYSQEGFHQYRGVSLTLGLQHCDNHQPYMANIAQVFPPPQHRRHELGSDDTTYYNTATPAG